MTAMPAQLIAAQRGHGISPRLPRSVLVGLWITGLASLLVGLQQQVMPRAFYDNFPGFGMHWVSADGPYNEHLLRDLGGANLALSLLTFFTIARPSLGLVRAVAAATLVAQVPHFIYHFTHLALLPSQTDRVLQTFTLGIVILIPLLVFIAAREMDIDAFVDSRQQFASLRDEPKVP